MGEIRLGNDILGQGIPKICVPLTGKTKEEVERMASEAGKLPEADLAEWRADYFDGHTSVSSVREVLGAIQACCPGLPLITTFRSAREGGFSRLSDELYASLVTAACRMGVWAVDLELSRGEEQVRKLIELCRSYGTVVILSSHEFRRTPSVHTMTARLEKMYEWGADLCKLAVMPENARDTLRLMEAALIMKEKHPDALLVTMAMGEAGKISRIAGERFASCLTFGSAGNESAPGQIPVRKLRCAMEALH